MTVLKHTIQVGILKGQI